MYHNSNSTQLIYGFSEKKKKAFYLLWKSDIRLSKMTITKLVRFFSGTSGT